MPQASRTALHGVPFAVKDNVDVAGLPTTAACRAFEYAPERTAPGVEALLRAGALSHGSTALQPEVCSQPVGVCCLPASRLAIGPAVFM